MGKTICFTGRRAKGLAGYDRENYNMFVSELAQWLSRSFCREEGTVKFISGGAQGFDQLAFWAVDLARMDPKRKADIDNTIYVPFRGQESVWKEDGLFSRSEYRAMLDTADHVEYLSEKPADFSGICRALTDRNHEMVDVSDMVVALYARDDWRTAKGGTAECMRYAEAAGKPIVQIKYEKTDSGELKGIFPELGRQDMDSQQERGTALPVAGCSIFGSTFSSRDAMGNSLIYGWIFHGNRPL